MKTTIANLSAERLEAEISAVYFAAHQEAPGVTVNEEKHPYLRLLWDDFEQRLAEGTIDPECDYAPKEWREGYYE